MDCQTLGTTNTDSKSWWQQYQLHGKGVHLITEPLSNLTLTTIPIPALALEPEVLFEKVYNGLHHTLGIQLAVFDLSQQIEAKLVLKVFVYWLQL